MWERQRLAQSVIRLGRTGLLFDLIGEPRAVINKMEQIHSIRFHLDENLSDRDPLKDSVGELAGPGVFGQPRPVLRTGSRHRGRWLRCLGGGLLDR